MIKVKAHIELYTNGRKTPFLPGYRPLFQFIEETRTSGSIELIDGVSFILVIKGRCLYIF